MLLAIVYHILAENGLLSSMSILRGKTYQTIYYAFLIQKISFQAKLVRTTEYRITKLEGTLEVF